MIRFRFKLYSSVPANRDCLIIYCRKNILFDSINNLQTFIIPRAEGFKIGLDGDCWMGYIGNTSPQRLCRIRTIKYYYNSATAKSIEHIQQIHFAPFLLLIRIIIKQVCSKARRELHLQCQNK